MFRALAAAALCLFAPALAPYCHAAEQQVPASPGMQYLITIKKFEMYNSSTGQWITVSNGPYTFDIASVSAGASAGSLVSGAKLTHGIYSKARVTIASLFRIKAFMPMPGMGMCTAYPMHSGADTYARAVECTGINDARLVATSIDFREQSLEPGDEAAAGGDLRVTREITPFTIGPGSTPRTASITFDIDKVLKFMDAGDLGPGMPAAFSPGRPMVRQLVE